MITCSALMKSFTFGTFLCMLARDGFKSCNDTSDNCKYTKHMSITTTTTNPKFIWEGAATPLTASWLQWAPHTRPKIIPTTCLIPGPTPPTVTNRIHICSAVLPQCKRQTHRPTDGWRKCSITTGRFLPRDAMLSAVYAVVMCLCVCLSVCHTPVLYQNGQT